MTSHLLSFIVFLPLVGALLVLLVPNRDEKGAAMVRQLGLVVSLVVFFFTLLLWGKFDASSADFQFVEQASWIPAFGIDYHLGVDGISLLLIVLTGFLTPISLLSSWESVEKKTKEFTFFVLALEAAMLGVFVSLDLFLFYVFWDAMLIPMYFLIGIWGYDRRIYAAIKFMRDIEGQGAQRHAREQHGPIPRVGSRQPKRADAHRKVVRLRGPIQQQ